MMDQKNISANSAEDVKKLENSLKATQEALSQAMQHADRLAKFASKVASMSIWGWDKDDGTPYCEAGEPYAGADDSHCAIMSLIEEARSLVGRQDENVSKPASTKIPRVLVVVSGGIADPIYDEGVDVEVFDWDNYADEEDGGKIGVPAHFSDLAEQVNVPVERTAVAGNGGDK
jgi:hypothetical protein